MHFLLEREADIEKFVCPFITNRVIKHRSNGEPRKLLSRRAGGKEDSPFSWLIVVTSLV